MAEESALERELEQMRTLRLGSFVNQAFLADCTLTTSDGKEFKAHKIILAAASGYFYRVFRTTDPKDKYPLPDPLLPRYSTVLRPSDVFPTVLRFIYSNQDEASLTEDSLNKSTAFLLFSLAHILEITSLVEFIGRFISDQVLTDANGPEILYEGVKFGSEILTEKAVKSTVRNFGDLVRGQKGLETLVMLPVEVVKGCLVRNDLNAQNEGVVFGFVCSYIQKREGIPQPEVAPQGEAQEGKKEPQVVLTPQQIAEQRMGLKHLTDEDKLSLLSCVRYPFLSHTELLQAASNALVAVAKDLVLEGLSVQLSSRSGPEVAGYTYRVNRTPRVAYGGKRLAEVRTSEEELGSGRLGSGDPEEETEGEYDPGMLRSEAMSRDILEEKPERGLKYSELGVKKTSTIPKKPSAGQEMYRSLPVRGQNIRGMEGDQRDKSPPRPPQQWPRHSKYALENQGPISRTPVREFMYQYDFDDNGAFFFLGSLGKTRPWENPHLINQIKVFASSVGAGRLEDLVGRSVTMLRTDDEPNSYFGVDLGPGRLFLPNAYTIRNRNSTSHVMLNWQFEASVDRSVWKVLDRRMHFTKDPEIDIPMEKEREALKQKGATSTWGVSQDMWRVKEGGEEPGFRYFRVVQVDKNSSGSFNLGLSGLEMYGLITAGRWP